MHVTGRFVDCSQCGGALWLEDERIEPVSALLIGIMACLRCGANFLYAAYPNGVRPAKRHDEDD